MMKHTPDRLKSLSAQELSQRIRDAAANLAIEGMELEPQELETLANLAKNAKNEEELVAMALGWIEQDRAKSSTAAE